MAVHSFSASFASDPVTEDFRREIAELAKTAREELHQREEEAISRSAKRRKVHPAILVGVVLILLELAMLGVMTYMRESELSKYTHGKQTRLASQNDCKGVAYRTARVLIGFRKANGRYPKSLTELVGNGVDRLPVDPQTNLPLVYASDGGRYTLACPKAPAAR